MRSWEEVENQRPPRAPRVLLYFGLSLAAVFTVFGLLLLLALLSWSDNDSPEIDQKAVAQAQAILREVAPDLDELPSLGGPTDLTEVIGCDPDDGPVFQPSAGREFAVPRDLETNALTALIAEMRARGWVVRGLDGSDHYPISIAHGEWTVRGYIFPAIHVDDEFGRFDRPLAVHVNIEGLLACATTSD